MTLPGSQVVRGEVGILAQSDSKVYVLFLLNLITSPRIFASSSSHRA